MEKEIIEFLKNIHTKWQPRKIKNEEKYVEYLNKKYPSYGLNGQLYFLRNKFSTECRCKNCNGVLNNFRKETCSKKCMGEFLSKSGAYDERNKKTVQTCLQRYGTSNPASTSEVQKKRLSTMVELYGSKVSPNSLRKIKSRAATMYEKGKITLEKSHGVTNPGQLPDHYEKCKLTQLKNYGVSHYTQTKEYQENLKQHKFNKWDAIIPDSIDLLEIERGSSDKPNDRFHIKCKSCNTLDMVAHETLKWRICKTGTPCAKCSGINQGSIKAKEVANYVESLGISVIRNDRTIISPLELDIVCTELKIAIEFCGLYWHNDLRLDKNYHKEKLKQCNKQGYTLITIFEDEWDYKKDIVKHRLRHLLCKNNERVYARKCEIKEVTTSTAKQFITQYHIQGYANSSVKLGLFHNNTMVGIMTFARASKAKGGTPTEREWEISRSCTSIAVVGGASKLFKYFTTHYSPVRIFSYADLRWGTGKVYAALGMVYDKDTALNYWYIAKGKRIHRFKLRKQQHEPKHITESDLRASEGYLRIWDCGNSKWEWHPEHLDK